jgi:putative ABC transport system ATP-binding protein
VETGAHRRLDDVADIEPGGIVAALGVERVYGEGEAQVRALDGVTVGLPAGGFTAIMGPSGSGKSTLMHLLAGSPTVTPSRARTCASPSP